MAADTTAMTLRLPLDLAAELAIVADCDGETVTDAIRSAVAAWVDRRKRDPHFQETLRRRIERHAALLDTRTEGEHR